MSLGNPSQAQLLQICRILWRWRTCYSCEIGGSDHAPDCDAPRLKYLRPFVDNLKTNVSFYNYAAGRNAQPLLQSWADFIYYLQKSLSLLIQQPKISRKHLKEALFQKYMHDAEANASYDAEQELAITLLLESSMMIKVGPVLELPSSSLELGVLSPPWTSETPWVAFVSECFPARRPALARSKDGTESYRFETALNAHNLSKIARLSLHPTSNIRDHLKLDRENNVVEIFHQAAFLKEQLRSTRDVNEHELKQSFGSLYPFQRELMLETLDTIQNILFPHSDPKSYAKLQSLCASKLFDPDCGRFESEGIRRPSETAQTYKYWGARLDALLDEVENPGPQGVFEGWLERRSSPRYVMLATLAGVLFAIFLGAAALVVAVVQTVIAYQAWKHPISR